MCTAAGPGQQTQRQAAVRHAGVDCTCPPGSLLRREHPAVDCRHAVDYPCYRPAYQQGPHANDMLRLQLGTQRHRTAVAPPCRRPSQWLRGSPSDARRWPVTARLNTLSSRSAPLAAWRAPPKAPVASAALAFSPAAPGAASSLQHSAPRSLGAAAALLTADRRPPLPLPGCGTVDGLPPPAPCCRPWRRFMRPAAVAMQLQCAGCWRRHQRQQWQSMEEAGCPCTGQHGTAMRWWPACCWRQRQRQR